MNEHASAWKPLIDEWAAREGRLHPNSPIRSESIRVRDAVEIDDLAYVLVSYDVEYPWPQEEDMPGAGRSENTAVLQALRVRQPWIERDAARALSQHVTGDRLVTVHEHPLGQRRAFSGSISEAWETVALEFEDGSTHDVQVVDGWFLAVVPDAQRVQAVIGSNGDGEQYRGELIRDDMSDLFDGMRIARTAPRTMYFSPLDLRGVIPLVQWQRVGGLVAVAVCLERYDEGGTLRLRVDGVRADDDMFVNWPAVALNDGTSPIASAICGEYAFADTITLDVGFRPWIPPDVEQMQVTITGLRGAEGPSAPVTIDLDLRSLRT